MKNNNNNKEELDSKYYGAGVNDCKNSIRGLEELLKKEVKNGD